MSTGLFRDPSRLKHTWETRRERPESVVVDPVTGVAYAGIEHNHVDRVAQLAGKPMAFHYGAESEHTVSRLITHWMGDDGFLKMYDCQDRMIVPQRDTIFGKGRVVKKYVENGEHLVDLAIWVESIRGCIVHCGVATVSLPTRHKA